MNQRYYGKYRGKVESNKDLMNLGRLQVSVPAVLGDGTMSWAMPCVPYAGPGVGLFAIPPDGANVWVEFEGGDPDYPIWSGCFWGTGDTPVMPALAEIKMLKTETIKLTLNDTPQAGGLTLEVADPAVTTPMKMVFDSSGILITIDPATLTMTTSKLELKHTTPTITIQSENVEVKHDPSKWTMTSSDIEHSNGSTSIKLTGDAIDIACTATGKFSGSGVELKNGSQSVVLSSSNVSVNDGALEVS